MKTYIDCIPCFFRQALFAARLATDDESKHLHIMHELGRKIKVIDLEKSPPEIAMIVYDIVDRITSNDNPYAALKHEYIERVKGILPQLEKQVAESQDPMRAAVRLSIAGNVIDFGAGESFDLQHEIENAMHTPFSIDHFDKFVKTLENARSILYLGDNAGETVLDIPLLKRLPKRAKYAVRGGPIINDATYDDAVQSGISEFADIVTTGLKAPGIIPSMTSTEFQDIWNKADIIISKGQGNYESLSNSKEPIFFLFKIKCPITARHIGSPKGYFVLKKGEK